jgi:hypothetical protein
VKNKDEVSGNRANSNEYSTHPPSAIGSIASIHSDELASAPPVTYFFYLVFLFVIILF